MWNWIKNLFTPEEQKDPHLVLYEDAAEPEVPVHKPDHCSTHSRFKKSCPLSVKNAPKVDYKNIKLLKRFVSENGKILPSRITNVSQKKQRELSLSIKRARNLALM